MEIPLLKDVIIIFGLSILVLLVCHRLKIPTLVGFIFTGVLCGPHFLGLVMDVENVETLSKIGIVLLLFMIGMEFSLEKIFTYKRFFLLGGSAQVVITVLGGIAIASMIGRPIGEAIFLGFLLSLSSTAIVLRLLENRGEGNSPHGRLATGILIFQDIVAVPMMLMIPFLSGSSDSSQSFVWLLAKGLLLVAFVFLAAVKIVPKILHAIAKTRSRELFLMSVLVLCFSVASLADWLGLSLSIGAFLAGLIVSESEYSNQALGDVLPIQDLFTSFFFVSVGMLLNLHFVMDHPGLILLIVTGIITLKILSGGLAGIICGMPLRTAILAGAALSQVGEFSFVLAKSGIEAGFANEYLHQLFLAVSLFTMALTPLLIAFSPLLATYALRLPLPVRLKSGLNPLNHVAENHLNDHVVIVGYGVTGRNIAKACKSAQIPYIILEMNAETVHSEKQKKEPIHFGDASHPNVLEHAHIKNARCIAIVVNDPMASMRIISNARKLNPALYIIARTSYVQEMHPLYSLGADDVIPNEFGTSIEILTHILRQLHIPSEEIEHHVDTLRNEAYDKLRGLFQYGTKGERLRVDERDVIMETLRIHDGSNFVGKKLEESGLKKNFGLTVIMIKRGNETVTDLKSDTPILAHDRIVVVGNPTRIHQAMESLKKV